MPISLLIIGSVILVSLVSLVGIFLAGLRERWMQRFLFCFISFAAGGLIGDVFIHILPEMIEENAEFFPTASLIVVIGLLLSFALEKIIHWHHCHYADCPTHKPLGALNLIGEGAHNFIDGLLIASSFLVDVRAGVATTIAVILHEIPQEIGDYAVLIYSGFTKKRALLWNFLSALTAILGAVVVLMLSTSLPSIEQYLFPLVAGNFLYIAIADLLPELHKQNRIIDAFSQLLCVFAGIGLMFLLVLLE